MPEVRALHSINARMTLGASLVLLVFLLATAFALDRAFRDSAQQAMQERLLGEVYLLIGAADVGSHGQLAVPVHLPEARFGLPASGLYASAVGTGGAVAWSSRSAIGQSLPGVSALAAGQVRFGTATNAQGKTFFVERLGVSWVANGQHYPFTFVVLEDTREFHAQVNRYRRSLWSSLSAMAVVLLVVQAALLRWGLAPLRRVATELTAIENGLQDKLLGDYPREIRRLSDNINTLLAHEYARARRYHDALGNLAHSLKTPLAVLRGTLSGRSAPAALRQVIDDEVAKMDRIVAYQLQRAGTEGASSRLRSSVRVAQVLGRILNSLGKVYQERAVEAHWEVAPELTFPMDEGDLMELLGNVLDNAFKWCARRIGITIGRQAPDAPLLIVVEDDGPGIDPQLRAHILERGGRGDELVPGHGIGLAIVHDVVAAYRGTLEIGRSRLGGARITVTLPG
ncbi:MAG: ATP-binding protein [Betaproteobacteria bacterium]|nr:ATP-binding protein [Betaproteobacteria bacterium]